MVLFSSFRSFKYIFLSCILLNIQKIVTLMSTAELREWTPRRAPVRATMQGQYARLEPLDAELHGDQLFSTSCAPDAEIRFHYLWEQPPSSREQFQHWLDGAVASQDPMFFAVIDNASNRVRGRQSYLRMAPANGVVELGHIYWGPSVAGTRVSTEAFFLSACHVFDDLGYRRYEWKCDALNQRSRKAALRYGFTFEGIFRQHMVVKGKNRDTAWFAILDSEWPTIRKAFVEWLKPQNFDARGRQLRRLEEFRAKNTVL